MSQQPPTGPTGTPGDADGPRTPGTPDEAGGEATESFARSPYDVPDTRPGTPAEPTYGQAPDPGRTIYSEASTTEPEPDAVPEEGRRRWVVPVVVAVILLLIAGGIAAALLLNDDDGEQDPVAPATVEATTDAEPTTAPTTEDTAAPTDEPTEEPTTPAATPEPTEPSTELREDLEETVSVEDLTFELSEEGFVPDEGIEGAVEAWRGVYVAGEYRIEMLATLWPDNEAADAFATRLVERTDGEQVDTGSTYTNDTGTYWAFFPVDGDRERGRYVWTTDRGHVLEITGHSDYISPFYSSFPL
ncbi:hypothetical protein [Georgenia sp. H159]|uniref:hypothetical protein n=1 Tax=Georgenia sp. H159 TaxID=3076115 RepID=UPI002D77179B|nr:hypothetical protein [Georgenia sp. H159]